MQDYRMQYFSRMVECPPRNVRNSSSSWAFGQLHDILSIGCHSVPEIYIFARRTHYNYADTLTSLVVGPYDSHCMVQFFFFLLKFLGSRWEASRKVVSSVAIESAEFKLDDKNSSRAERAMYRWKHFLTVEIG